MAEDPDRSKKLLSKDAVPEVSVPDSAPIEAPAFRLPSAIGQPARPPDASGDAGGDHASGKAARRRRPSTGRFRDRTLNWFKSGDELDPDAAPASGEYAPAPVARPAWVVPAIAGGVVVVVLIVVLAVV